MPRELPPGAPSSVGPWVVVAGLVIVLIGVLIWTGALSWFGRLPGDVRYEGERARVYVPWVSMLVISLLISLVSYVVRRFW